MVLEKTKKFKSLTKGRLLIRLKHKPTSTQKDPFLDDSVEVTEDFFEVVENLQTDLGDFVKGDYVTLTGKANLKVFEDGDFIYYSVDPKAVLAIYENEA